VADHRHVSIPAMAIRHLSPWSSFEESDCLGMVCGSLNKPSVCLRTMTETSSRPLQQRTSSWDTVVPADV